MALFPSWLTFHSSQPPGRDFRATEDLNERWILVSTMLCLLPQKNVIDRMLHLSIATQRDIDTR